MINKLCTLLLKINCYMMELTVVVVVFAVVGITTVIFRDV